ncbi:MAG TPA: ABC transporter substrate-binding protein [Hyphomicrobiales bacterium]|nr:ABC transporter substrate-binding protein [Hyphomicrobiales bacterium]
MFDRPLDRRQLLGGAAALAGATALPLLGAGPADAAALQSVRYLTPFGFLMGFAAVLYGETGGFFAKEGLDVVVEGGRGSAMAVQQVTAGNVLLSRTGGTDLIKAYAKDPSIVAIAEIYNRDIFYVISQESKPIASPADMAGKTIGVVSTGGATENLLDMMLAAKDVPASSVKRETVGTAPSAFELVKLGRVAAFIATADTVFQLQTDKAPIHAWSTDDYAPAPGQVYMTSKATLAKDTETLAKFLRAVYASIGDMIAKKDNLGPVIASMTAKYEIPEAKRPDKGLAVLKHALSQTYGPPYADKLASNPKQWQSAYALMVKAKIIQPTADQNFYDDRARKLAFS